MERHSENTFDAEFVGAILDDLPKEQRARIYGQAYQRGMALVDLFEFMIGPGGWGTCFAGDAPIDHAWREAARLRDAIPKERKDDAVEAEIDRREAVKTLIAPPLIEVPVLRKRPGPYGHDDRKNLMRMRELLRTRYEVRGSWTAASMIVGRDDKDRIKGLKKKYDDWEADRFPTEWVPAQSVRG